MKRRLILMAVTFMMLGLCTNLEAATYTVDADASQMAFRIRHAVGFNSGFVQRFSGSLDVSRKYELQSLEIDADMASITTFNEARDPIIHSSDFFDVEQFPQGQIRSRKIEDGFMTATVHIKGIKQDVTFYYQFLGLSKNDRGEEIAVVTMQGVLKKADFDLEYSSLTLEGNENIGKTLDLFIKLEAVRK